MNRKPGTLVVVPVFNEARFLPAVLRGLAVHAGVLDVLVVDDGSTDESRAIALQHGTLLAQHAYNAGYGATIQTGLKYALRHGYEYATTVGACSCPRSWED